MSNFLLSIVTLSSAYRVYQITLNVKGRKKSKIFLSQYNLCMIPTLCISFLFWIKKQYVANPYSVTLCNELATIFEDFKKGVGHFMLLLFFMLQSFIIKLVLKLYVINSSTEIKIDIRIPNLVFKLGICRYTNRVPSQ